MLKLSIVLAMVKQGNQQGEAELTSRGNTACPNLVLEHELATNYPKVGYIDECGRGAVGGGAYVGVVVITSQTLQTLPPMVNDSKKLTQRKRYALVKSIQDWVYEYGVGFSSASEVDAYGINASLLLAAMRSYNLNSLDYIVLDGKHNWLTDPKCLAKLRLDANDAVKPPVKTIIKGDGLSVGLACASILCKVKHDMDVEKLMEVSPEFMWDTHKGYPTKNHKNLLRKYGYTVNHRKTWNLT